MWSASIPIRAGQIFFFVILLQIPLFRVPCRSGTCTSPLQITAAQLVTSKVIPHGVVKALLYPGACIQTIFSVSTLPQWSTLFEKYNLTDVTTQSVELNRLELLIGSYFAVAGRACLTSQVQRLARPVARPLKSSAKSKLK
ncbi:hypothetical protein GOP47_0016787 [Adiantum capillus-veneris]|uniref:Secreted protein n=1 Tax=Adiantum capillus-veneris TaxID=13818 RepID=A0A9D4UJ07_ADICA|nr:hypothetical protein GOP47_0016787 [Adiantum capillus-veneris]